jgi:hypothetical protein
VGAVPRQGWWWRELKEANKPQISFPKYTKVVPKMGSFPHLKIAENAAFYSRVFNKIHFQLIF